MSTHNKRTGIVLMSYGSATTAEHVREYFEHIHPEKVSASLVQEFERRYRRIGRSPLIDITLQQASLLQKRLGDEYVVRAGMRHSAPFIEEAVRACKDAGATSLIGIILAPQFTSFIKDGYASALMDAATQHQFERSDVTIAPPWPTEPHFIQLLVSRVRKSQENLQQTYGRLIPVIFTTHSLPQRIVEKDATYLEQLQQTITAVRQELDPTLQWYAGYQSAGHTPEAWLKPDLTDLLDVLNEKKSPAVLIVPIQFLSDHLEVLYDLDIAARDQCTERGIAYHRIELPNIDPLFIQTLESVVYQTLQTSK